MNLPECLIAGFVLTTSAVALAKLQFQWQQQLTFLKDQQTISSEHHINVWKLYQAADGNAEPPVKNIQLAVQQHVRAIQAETRSPFAFTFNKATLQYLQAVTADQSVNFEETESGPDLITRVALSYEQDSDQTGPAYTRHLLLSTPSTTPPLARLNFARLHPETH